MSLCGNNNPCPDLITGQKCGITYTGARYVPLFADPAQWDNTKAYEPLTIVLNEGNSYTSKTFVPVGVDISNEMYWALTGNYNAQVEAYRQEVKELSENVTNLENTKVSKTAIYSLDNFDGATNEEKLITALNTISEGTILCGEIIATQKISFTGDKRKVTILGAQLTNTTIDGWLNSPGSFAFCPSFSNCYINSPSPLFGGSYIVGTYLTRCYLDNTVLYNNSSGLVQSLYIFNCEFNQTSNFCNADQYFDLKLIGCRIEEGGGYIFKSNHDINNEVGVQQCSITDNLIENRTAIPFQFTAPYGLTIENNYIENNTQGLLSFNNANSNYASLYFLNNFVFSTATAPLITLTNKITTSSLFNIKRNSFLGSGNYTVFNNSLTISSINCTSNYDPNNKLNNLYNSNYSFNMTLSEDKNSATFHYRTLDNNTTTMPFLVYIYTTSSATRLNLSTLLYVVLPMCNGTVMNYKAELLGSNLARTDIALTVTGNTTPDNFAEYDFTLSNLGITQADPAPPKIMIVGSNLIGNTRVQN